MYYCDFLNDVDEVEIRRFFSLRKSENRKNNEIVSRCIIIIIDWLCWLERYRESERNEAEELRGSSFADCEAA